MLFKLNGQVSAIIAWTIACRNTWIVKPAGKSRGRDIVPFTSLVKILKYVNRESPGKPSQWIVQKYIENPLIIGHRKFDIRQWVLVTNWNPLTIWFYNDCYLRFAVEVYEQEIHNSASSLEEDEIWTADKYRHLVNNSITKSSDKFNSSFLADNGREVTNHMWPLSEFKQVRTRFFNV